jgi:hypothetical protein
MFTCAVSVVEQAVKDYVEEIEKRMPPDIKRLMGLLYSDLMGGPIYVDQNMNPTYLQYSEFAPRVYYQDSEGETRVMGEDPEIDSVIEEMGLEPGEKYESGPPTRFNFTEAAREVLGWLYDNIGDVWVTEDGSIYESETQLIKDAEAFARELLSEEGLDEDEMEERLEKGYGFPEYYSMDRESIMREILGSELYRTIRNY